METEHTSKLRQIISFFFKHPLLSVLLLTIAILTLFVFIFSLFAELKPTPSTPKSTSLDLITPVPQNTSYEGVTFRADFTNTLPTEADVYQKNSTSLSQDKIKNIAEGFGFSTEPQILGGDSYWTSDTSILQISPSSSFVSLTNTNRPNTGIPSITQADQISSAAAQLVKSKGINTTNIDTKTPLIQYMTRFSEQPAYTNDFTQATVFLVSLPQTIQGITIYRQYGQPSNVTVVFDRYLNIIQLSYYDIPTSFTTLKRVQLITITELKNTITTGKGAIRQPYNLQLETGGQTSALTFTLTTASLGYLIDSTSQELQPVFVTKGVVSGSQIRSQEAILYVPAVK